MHCNENCTKILAEDNIVNGWDGLLFNQFKSLTQNLNNMSILDIGANIGSFTLVAAQYKNVKRIFAIEPSNSNFERLKHNASYSVEHNKIKLINSAISNKNEKHNIFCGNGTCETYNILGDRFTNEHVLQEVNCITLDDLSKKLDQTFDIIKIDVEGAECLVLEGGINTIQKSKYVFLEIHGEQSNNFRTVLDICNNNNWTALCLKHLHKINTSLPLIDYCYQVVIIPN